MPKLIYLASLSAYFLFFSFASAQTTYYTAANYVRAPNTNPPNCSLVSYSGDYGSDWRAAGQAGWNNLKNCLGGTSFYVNGNNYSFYYPAGQVNGFCQYNPSSNWNYNYAEQIYKPWLSFACYWNGSYPVYGTATRCSADTWSCGSWSSCNNGTQTRSCTMTFDCPYASTPSPATSQSCVSSYSLNVSKSGSGTVTSNPAGINCGNTCSANYNGGTTVTLSASPSPGNVFIGWSGDCSGTGSCVLNMNSAKLVNANFSSPFFNLNAAKSGAGSGTVTGPGINCGFTCSSYISDGASVTLSATPDTNSTFAFWSLSTWTNKGAGYIGKAVAVNGKIYVISGFDWPETGGPVRVYDPATNSWTSKATVPPSAYYYGQNAVAAVNDKIYSISGIGTMEEYNTITDSWTSKARIPTARYGGASTAVVNGKIYVIGGNTASFGKENEEYNPATNQWTKKTNIPTGRYYHVTATAKDINGQDKIYAIGGRRNTGGITVIGTTEAYDPATNSWTLKVPMPTARWTAGATVVNGKIYVIGGYDSSQNEEYDPVTDVWTKREPQNSNASEGTGCAAVNNKIYAINRWATEEYDFAKPQSGSDICSGTGACTFTMNVYKSAAATFNISSATLNVIKSVTGTGSGTVTGSGINCGSVCSKSYPPGTSITLTASPAPDSVFTGWSGDCSGLGTCNLIMNVPKTVTATFNKSAAPSKPGEIKEVKP